MGDPLLKGLVIVIDIGKINLGNQFIINIPQNNCAF